MISCVNNGVKFLTFAEFEDPICESILSHLLVRIINSFYVKQMMMIGPNDVITFLFNAPLCPVVLFQ